MSFAVKDECLSHDFGFIQHLARPKNRELATIPRIAFPNGSAATRVLFDDRSLLASDRASTISRQIHRTIQRASSSSLDASSSSSLSMLATRASQTKDSWMLEAEAAKHHLRKKYDEQNHVQ